MSGTSSTILWLRHDLRLADNPALAWAVRRGSVIPVFIHENGTNPCPTGGATQWWLHENLALLGKDYARLDVQLLFRRGKPEKILQELIKESGASAVTWNRCYEPATIARDAKLADMLTDSGVTVETHAGFLLFEPKSIRTGGGTPFKVYTPFSKACFAAVPPEKPIPAPKSLSGVKGLRSDTLDDLKLVPRKAVWPKGLADAWDVGEKAAHDRLRLFIDKILVHYKNGRNSPAKDYTSRLSPYLHFGNISPRHVWHAIQFATAKDHALGSNAERFLLELLWREFSWHLLQHFPHLTTEPMNKSFASFPWKKDKKGLEAWQQGMTGYPIIDAGMRQLWQTGWMHNRVRMVVASFLIKDLLIHWQDGMAWFWDTLVDADLGNNTASWQWVAGCGADAAPYFRIFNPTLQGEKFDPDGDYIRQYIPKLARLDAKFIHQPWKAPAEILTKAGVKLGKTYPLPIIDHGKARERALAALAHLKNPGQQPTETEDLFG